MLLLQKSPQNRRKIAAKSPQKIAVFAQKIVKNAFLYNICGDFFSKCGKFIQK